TLPARARTLSSQSPTRRPALRVGVRRRDGVIGTSSGQDCGRRSVPHMLRRGHSDACGPQGDHVAADYSTEVATNCQFAVAVWLCSRASLALTWKHSAMGAPAAPSAPADRSIVVAPATDVSAVPSGTICAVPAA